MYSYLIIILDDVASGITPGYPRMVDSCIEPTFFQTISYLDRDLLIKNPDKRVAD